MQFMGCPPNKQIKSLSYFLSSCTAGTCIFPGAKGGLAVLDIIEKKPFHQVYMHLLPSLGGYQAAYLAYDTTNRAVGLLVCAQLVMTDAELSPLTADAADMAACARCVIRVIVHTASLGAAASMRANPAHWLRELTDGSVSMAVAATKGVAPPAPLLSNRYAHVAVQFHKDLTPDPDAEVAAVETGAEGEEDGEKLQAKGMQEAAAGLAKLAHSKAKKDAAAAAEVDSTSAAGGQQQEELQVEEIAEQTGDDWMHIAVLSQWQQMHDAAAQA
jgi:hypothetical protein